MSTRICKIDGCTNKATNRYTECNPCREFRKGKLNNLGLEELCFKCKNKLDNDEFNSCLKCMEDSFSKPTEIEEAEKSRKIMIQNRLNIIMEGTDIPNINNKKINNKIHNDHIELIVDNQSSDNFSENNDLYYDQIDKKIHLKKLTPEYLGGLFDGDGSFVIQELKTGFQMFVILAQSVTNILELLVIKYGGKISHNTNAKTETNRNQYSYRVCGKFAQDLLFDLARGCIMKKHQAETCLKFLPLIGKVNMTSEKKILCSRVKLLNSHDIDVVKPYEDLNDDYLAGLFDA